jgi:hypothetical protein
MRPELFEVTLAYLYIRSCRYKNDLYFEKSLELLALFIRIR